ncbi:MAG: hypothetical protein HW416_1378 [Chloroflexi bacterium]|nr:hypothetical protein [Chloroflexota bacterium]
MAGTTDNPIERLRDVVERHVRAEADSIQAYEQIARTAPDSLVATLMRMVLEDERRHHAVFQSMFAILEDMLSGLSRTPSPEVPADPSVASILEDAAREEREGAERLLQLAREQGTLCEGMFGLLLDLMARDSQKHERILDFAARRLRGAALAQ